MADQNSVLTDLVQTLEDGREGFEQSAERMQDEDATIADRLRELSRQRAEFSRELRDLASSHGEPIDEDGSMAAGLHRGWISLKDALTGDSPEAILKAAESGEEHAVEEYEDALESDELGSDVRQTVQRQSEAIAGTHREVKEMAQRYDDSSS